MKCYTSPQMHIGTCLDNFDSASCTCDPIDAAEYPIDQNLCCVVTMPGASNPRLKTYIDDVLKDDWSVPRSHVWCGICWHPWVGRHHMRFEFCDGSRVIYSKETWWGADVPNKSGNVNYCNLKGAAEYDEVIDFRVGARNTSVAMIPLKVCIYHAETLVLCTDSYPTSPYPGPGRMWDVSLTMPSFGEHASYEFRLMSGDELLDTHTRVVRLPVADPCAGVVCDPECFGDDLHDTGCEEGVCVKGRLLEEDSLTCYVPPDLCEGVTCNHECFGSDYFTTVCEAGECVRGQLLEEDSSMCGGTPHEGEIDIGDIVKIYGFTGQFCGYHPSGKAKIVKERGSGCSTMSIGMPISRWALVKKCKDITTDDSKCWQPPYGIECPVTDPCDGVICEPECFDDDLHETSCDEGVCIKGVLIEADSAECGYVPPDPCEGITCAPECFGDDLHDTVCDEGVCVKGRLLEEDSQTCGYEPPDPCTGVVCEPGCFGTAWHATTCVAGECVKGVLIEANSAKCGYVPPTPPEPEDNTMLYAGLVVVLGLLYAYLRR